MRRCICKGVRKKEEGKGGGAGMARRCKGEVRECKGV